MPLSDRMLRQSVMLGLRHGPSQSTRLVCLTVRSQSRNYTQIGHMRHTGRSGPLRTAMAWNCRGSPFLLAIGCKRTMYIQTETTPNESALKFIPGVTVLSSGTAEFLDSRSAMSSPLAKRIFQIDGVRSVFYGPDFITISKDDDANWQLMKPDIYASIMDFFASGNAVVDDEGRYGGNPDTEILDDDSENVAMIKELLETRVRPAIQEDGGDIEYRGFDEETGTVSLKLKGACRDCSSSVVTLKNGIQSMLSHYIPAVNSVEQVIDAEESISNAEFAKLEQKLNEAKSKQAHVS